MTFKKKIKKKNCFKMWPVLKQLMTHLEEAFYAADRFYFHFVFYVFLIACTVDLSTLLAYIV